MSDRWEQEVTVELDGEVRLIASTMDAADCLFTCMADRQGSEYDKAMQSFADVFDGREPPETARNAFLQVIDCAGNRPS
ncbi:DUF982 domain-containing protein [Aliirhizobium smilacinae]|uniref:DUF982 domain-containing protein n=1 Tax=Aliirhizobium smilacinae TaxID=1395944 RepID=A0A5C4XQX5_9HYPH|nr:DUF982 domain-containing protein [Rhizobium smilacinae]TNM64964.1 DUF982 domain-containing protein [Rhizobium smilacinae]